MGASDGKIHLAAGMPVTRGGPAEEEEVSEPESRRLRSGLLFRIGEPLSGFAACSRGLSRLLACHREYTSIPSASIWSRSGVAWSMPCHHRS